METEPSREGVRGGREMGWKVLSQTNEEGKADLRKAREKREMEKDSMREKEQESTVCET